MHQMMRPIPKRLLAACGFALIVACCATRGTEDMAELVQLAHQTAREPSNGRKAEDAVRIVELTHDVSRAGRAGQIPEATIDDFVAILSDGLTTLAACEALAELGPRARRTIPQVESAIAEREREIPGPSDIPAASPVRTSDAFRTCLTRIRAS
jgi:hypothetical protein